MLQFFVDKRSKDIYEGRVDLVQKKTFNLSSVFFCCLAFDFFVSEIQFH